MRYITADYIFPISSPPIPNGIVVVNDDGVIEDVINPEIRNQIPHMREEIRKEELEIYRGILCPGFINSHCHLELSHLKGMLSEGKGLTQFIREIIPKRNASPEVIQQAIVKAEDEMIANGVVGVGDICNSNHTFVQKAKGRFRYHNFIELFDLDANNAVSAFEKGILLAEELTGAIPHMRDQISNLKSEISLTPHAPYTVSSKLLKLIKAYAEANDSILSIHNQETSSENEMFVSGKGDLIETLKSLNSVFIDWKPTGLSSFASTLAELATSNKMLMVHNTYTTKEDIVLVNLKSQISNLKSLYWCFCPNANLFIEKRLPDFRLFMDGSRPPVSSGYVRTGKITIGTDSYASNWSLSILDELKTIHHHKPDIPLATLLQWATLNGAEFFGWDKELGSIEKGKRPGFNLIEYADLFKMQLTPESSVKKIV